MLEVDNMLSNFKCIDYHYGLTHDKVCDNHLFWWYFNITIFFDKDIKIPGGKYFIKKNLINMKYFDRNKLIDDKSDHISNINYDFCLLMLKCNICETIINLN